jgi:hypothetical protein
MRKQSPGDIEIRILELLRRSAPRNSASEVLDPDDHAPGCIASLLKLTALQSTVALHNYSQRRHISLVESYVKDIPDGDDGSNSCDRRYLSRRLCGESPSD